MGEDIAIVIFGGTGDLSHKKLFPALLEVFAKQKNIHIIGVGRRELTDEEFIASFQLPDTPDTKDFLTHISYHKGDFDDLTTFTSLKERLQTQNTLFYLAVEPSYFEPIITFLQQSGLNTTSSRVVIEKPFGNDKEGAQHL